MHIYLSEERDFYQIDKRLTNRILGHFGQLYFRLPIVITMKRKKKQSKVALKS